MNTRYPSSLAMRGAAVCACLFASQAMGGTMPFPSHLPACHSYIEADTTCRLPLKNGTFARLAGWEALGHAALGEEGDKTYVSLSRGASIEQPVYAMFYKWQGATYALRFLVRAESSDAEVDASLYMSNGLGRNASYIGSVKTIATTGAWRVVELVANGVRFPPPAHVLVSISHGGGDSAVQVTDVALVESPQAEAVEAVEAR